MRLYDKLSRLKDRGQKLDMEDMSRETLLQLWWKEEISDIAIASLFDVPKKKVTNQRHKWGIKMPETIVSEFEEKFAGVIPASDDVAQQLTAPVAFANARALIRKINDLNDIELDTLRTELAQRFPLFANVKQEVEFLALVERAIQQFRNEDTV